tara:strand:+ start:596 stop:871 length:276 start_codon:yes stop_codon:yes gene_type:complete
LNTGDAEQGEELALLVQIVGWRRAIRPEEMDAAARLEFLGLICLEVRKAGRVWGQATREGMELGAPVLSSGQHGVTIARYWRSKRGEGGDE